MYRIKTEVGNIKVHTLLVRPFFSREWITIRTEILVNGTKNVTSVVTDSVHEATVNHIQACLTK